MTDEELRRLEMMANMAAQEDAPLILRLIAEVRRLMRDVENLTFGRNAAEGEAREVHADYTRVLEERDRAWRVAGIYYRELIRYNPDRLPEPGFHIPPQRPIASWVRDHSLGDNWPLPHWRCTSCGQIVGCHGKPERACENCTRT